MSWSTLKDTKSEITQLPPSPVLGTVRLLHSQGMFSTLILTVWHLITNREVKMLRLKLQW
jgi:hypothetical protein